MQLLRSKQRRGFHRWLSTVLLSSFGKTKVWKFKTRTSDNQSCTNHLFNTQPGWSKSDQAFSRENPLTMFTRRQNREENNGLGVNKDWENWPHCEARDCSRVFGKRCWTNVFQARQILPRFLKRLLRKQLANSKNCSSKLFGAPLF